MDGRLQEVLLRTNRQRTGQYCVFKNMLSLTLFRDRQRLYLSGHNYYYLITESVSFGCATKIGLNGRCVRGGVPGGVW